MQEVRQDPLHSRPVLLSFIVKDNSHSYTHLVLALGIIREPTIWGFITTKRPGSWRTVEPRGFPFTCPPPHLQSLLVNSVYESAIDCFFREAMA